MDGSIYKVVVAEGQSGAVVVTEDGPELIDEASRETAVSDGATPPKLRAKVLARDGHRCKSCGTTRSLHAHHVKWRVHGGETRLANLVTVCGKCHGLLHEGLLQVAPGATLWESVGFEFRDREGRVRDRLEVDGSVLEATRLAVVEDPLVPVEPGFAESFPDWFERRDGFFVMKSWARDRFGELELRMGTVCPLSECEGAAATG